MVKHKKINCRFHMHSGDCYLYENDCTCGKSFGGWSEKEADENIEKHLNKEIKNE